MKTRVFLLIPLVLGLLGGLVGGCGSKISSDLELSGQNFNYEGKKAVFQASVKNKGTKSYNTVYLVADLFQGREHVTQLKTAANLTGGARLEPGGTVGISGEFEDGGLKPDRVKIVRFYGVE